MGLLSGVDNLEHLLLANTLDLRQGHSKLSSLLITLVLDSTGESLGVGLLRAVEQVLGQRSLGRLVGCGRLDVLLLLGLDTLLHLNLLLVAVLLVQLGPQTTQVLGIVRRLVSLTSLALACALLVIEALAMLLLPALDIPGKMSVGDRAVAGGERRTRSEAVGGRKVSKLMKLDIERPGNH